MNYSFESKLRNRNYDVKRDVTCMMCGRSFPAGSGIYGRRFCSEECRNEYLG
ncbi:MAG: hypothetical protein HYW50_02355 [Candidatus Diapherotrites archaeon]|nr:hypothetical protein [Candidatus Diapherotrites archaeon]